MPWQPGLPQSEWYATLEPLAEAYLAELGVERNPQLYALDQMERWARAIKHRHIALEWGRRSKAALGLAWTDWDDQNPPRFLSPHVLSFAPPLPPSPKLFFLKRPPVPTSGVQLESARAQLAAWEASGQTLAETERLTWWVHPSDFEALREALVQWLERRERH